MTEMQYIEIPEFPILCGEDAIKALYKYISELKEQKTAHPDGCAVDERKCDLSFSRGQRGHPYRLGNRPSRDQGSSSKGS